MKLSPKDSQEAQQARGRIAQIKAKLAEANPGKAATLPADEPAGSPPQRTLTLGDAKGQATLPMGPAGQETLPMGPSGASAPSLSAPAPGEVRTSAPGWQEGSVVEGIYEVEAMLGEGGFGSVHKVRHLD